MARFELIFGGDGCEITPEKMDKFKANYDDVFDDDDVDDEKKVALMDFYCRSLMDLFKCDQSAFLASRILDAFAEGEKADILSKEQFQLWVKLIDFIF